MAGRNRHYSDFRPFYLKEHGKPLTRALHGLGTAIALVLLGADLITTDWPLLAGGARLDRPALSPGARSPDGGHARA